jgi:diketogulonate reductase-like aldo/keto reductase
MCVRPDHLFVGTAFENMRDAARKDRLSRAHNPPGKNRGASHGMSKLTDEKVRDIRTRHANGETQAALAREFAITTGAVCMIVKRKRWAHV